MNCGTTCFTTTASAATTQLKTYTDPSGFFTLQYPADWTVEYKQPVTKFDEPTTIFTTKDPVSIVTITITPSKQNSPEAFRDVISLLPSEMANSNRGMTITGEGFGRYFNAG